jgi:hypothetical protein
MFSEMMLGMLAKKISGAVYPAGLLMSRLVEYAALPCW